MTRIRLLSLAAVAMLGAGLVAGCGGDDGGDEDPQQVLDETFDNPESVDSGVLDISVSGSAEGEQGGNIDASLSGPFQSEEDKFPELDLTATVSGEGGGQSIDFTGGLITTTDAAYVSYQDTNYEVPKPFFQQLQQASEQAQAQAGGQDQDSGAVFEQLGIDPSTWLTNLENEGDEDVEGTETVHIHGDANVPQILDDLQSAAEQTGTGTGTLTPDQISQVEEAVSEASIDVYSGTDDRILRRLDLNLGLEAPAEAAASGVENVDVEFSLTLSDVNQPQTIEAPSDTQPFSQLEQDLGLPPGLLEGALSGGGLSPSLGGAAPGGGGGLSQGEIGKQFGVPPGAGGGGGGVPGGGGGGDAYAKCLQQATTADEIQACINQL